MIQNSVRTVLGTWSKAQRRWCLTNCLVCIWSTRRERVSGRKFLDVLLASSDFKTLFVTYKGENNKAARITWNQGHEKMMIYLGNCNCFGMAGAQGIYTWCSGRKADRDQIIKDLYIWYLKKRVWVLFLGDWLATFTK